MIHPFNSFFDKIYVISIKRNKQRLDAFLKENIFLNIEVFEGVDGIDLFPQLEHVWMFPKEYFLENGLSYDDCCRWNKGQLGCAISHLSAQKSIVENGFRKVLILEDDALIDESRINYFKNAIQEIPENWDLFYLGYNTISRWSENRHTKLLLKIKHLLMPTNIDGLSSSDFNKQFFSKSFSKNLNIPGVYGGTHAYAISYEGAKKIIDISTPLQYASDTTLMYANYHKLINSYSMKKQIIIPNSIYPSTLIN